MISPSTRSATSTASSLFPVPVAPVITIASPVMRVSILSGEAVG
jgi:hypothetical protein